MSKSSISQDLADLRAQMQSFRRVLDNTSQNISRITNNNNQNSSSSLKLSTSFSPVRTNKSKTNDTYTYETTQRIFQTLKFSAVSSSSDDSEDENFNNRRSRNGEKPESIMRVSEIISDDELRNHENDSDDESNFLNHQNSRSKKVTIVEPIQRKTPKTGNNRQRTVVEDLEDIISPTTFKPKTTNNQQQFGKSRNNYIHQISPIMSVKPSKNDAVSPMRDNDYTPNTRKRHRTKKTPKKSIREFLLESTSSSGSDMDDDSSDDLYIPKKSKQNVSKLPFFSITADDEILIQNPNTNTRIARLSKSLLEKQQKEETEAQLDKTGNEKGKNANTSMEFSDPVVVFSSSTKDPLSSLSLYSTIYNDITPSRSRTGYQRRDIPEYKNRTPIQRKSNFSSRLNDEVSPSRRQQSDRPLVTNRDISQIFKNLPVITQTDSDSDDDSFSFKPPVADSIPNMDYLNQLDEIIKEQENKSKVEQPEEEEKRSNEELEEESKKQKSLEKEDANEVQKEDKETLTEVFDTKSQLLDEPEKKVSQEVQKDAEPAQHEDTANQTEDILSKVKKLDMIFTSSDDDTKELTNQTPINATSVLRNIDKLLDEEEEEEKEVQANQKQVPSSHEEEIIEIEEIKNSSSDKQAKPEEKTEIELKDAAENKEGEKSDSSDDDYNDDSDDETEVKLNDLTPMLTRENETSAIPKQEIAASNYSPKQEHTTTEIQEDINFDSASSVLDEGEQPNQEQQQVNSPSKIHNSSYMTESEIEDEIKKQTLEHLQKLNSSIKEMTFVSSSEEPVNKNEGEVSDGAALDQMLKELQSFESPDDLKGIDNLLDELQKEIQK